MGKCFKLSIISLAIVTFAGCALLAEEETTTLHVHIQASFNEEVRVEVNGQVVFHDEVRSTRAGYTMTVGNEEPGFIEMQTRQGDHHIRVWANGHFLADTTFRIANSTFLGIGRHRDRYEAIFRVQQDRFTYM